MHQIKWLYQPSISLSEAYVVVFSIVLLVLELVVLPIHSELTSIPDETQPTTTIIFTFIHASIWPGIPMMLCFFVPLVRSLVSIWYQNPTPRDRFLPKLITIGWLLSASIWELAAILVLREHRQHAFESGTLVETELGVRRGVLCQQGPFLISRHPINVGLIWTCLAYAIIDGLSLPTLFGSLLFSSHLVFKTHAEEDWLRTVYEKENWELYAKNTSMFLPVWLFVILLLPFSIALFKLVDRRCWNLWRAESDLSLSQSKCTV